MNNYTILIRESRFFLGSFPFTWEQRKFSETFVYLQNNALSRADLNYEQGLIKNVHYGDVLIKFGEILDVDSAELPFISNNEFTVSSTSLLQNGDVIIADAAEDETVGKCSEIKGIEGINVVSGLHTIPCRPNKTFASGYLGYYLNSSAYHDQLLPLIQGTKISSISKSALLNTDIIYPDSEQEQLQIGQFFQSLDNLITLHQRKHEYSYKACLGEILSLSLKFTPTWEQRKLGELSDSFEYGLNAAATEYDGENKYIRITDIDDVSRRFVETDLTSPKIGLSNAENYKLKIGDILFARTGASVGKSYIYNESDGLVYYAGFLIRTRIKPEYNAEFVFQSTLTSQYNDYIRINSQRSGQPGVNAQEYAEFSFLIPEFDEQYKIGTFFRNLDNLITLHQRECNLFLARKFEKI
jgi:type I restriction enzyme S subunit